MKVAIIPARGGSKRIPRKNIKEFAGKPMIAYAINAALESKLFNRVIVSTDDEEIASIAKIYGAETPFMRPKELADDSTTTVPVISHAIQIIQKEGAKVDYVCCLYPCIPFIQIADLVSAFNLLIETGAGYSYPITEFPSAIQRGLHQMPDGRISPLNPQYEWTRSQDLPSTFYDAGQFYWGKSSSWLEGLGLQTSGAGLRVPNWRVVDIDTPEDWFRAELLHGALNLCKEDANTDHVKDV
jgi:pseudaminic acid cytidylyltransferase